MLAKADHALREASVKNSKVARFYVIVLWANKASYAKKVTSFCLIFDIFRIFPFK